MWMRSASLSLMRSGEVSGTRRPSRRFSSDTMSSRPASMRVLHQAPPPVATSVTRSPSRTPVFRNCPMASFARCAWNSVRWTSSKTITNERPVRSSRDVLSESAGLRAGSVEEAAGTCTFSKLVTSWGTPSSRIVNSSRGMPEMVPFFLSVTTTSTVTTSTPAANVGVPASAAGEGAGAGVAAGACARATLARARKRTGSERFINPPAPGPHRPRPSRGSSASSARGSRCSRPW